MATVAGNCKKSKRIAQVATRKGGILLRGRKCIVVSNVSSQIMVASEHRYGQIAGHFLTVEFLL
jgi:hypothetical protein